MISSIEFLRDSGILATYAWCTVCDIQMSNIRDKTRIDGEIFRCKLCRATQLIILQSALEGSNISLGHFITLIYFWSNKCTRVQLSTFLDINEKYITGYTKMSRKVCLWKLGQLDIRIGGEKAIVQIKESVFYKAKYHKGHALFWPPKWVLGLYDVDKKIGVVRFVKDRSAKTLLTMIQEVVMPGSCIHTDKLGAYQQISNLSVVPKYEHSTVNHSKFFKDPETGIHTNNVEAYWCSIKRKFKQMNGVPAILTSSYLDEDSYIRRFGLAPFDLFINIIEHIAEFDAFE